MLAAVSICIKNVTRHITVLKRGCVSSHFLWRAVRIPVERFYIIGRNFYEQKRSSLASFSACGGSLLRQNSLPPHGDPRGAFLCHRTQFPMTKNGLQMLGGRKTVICEFLGTGMISVMPVPLLSVHPREYSQQGHIRYVPSVCACRWTCPVPPHKPLLQAL